MCSKMFHVLFPHNPPVVDCGSVMVSSPLQVSQTNTTFNSTITYSCQLGYNLVGTPERTCQANGSYTGVEPSCMSELLVWAAIKHYLSNDESSF